MGVEPAPSLPALEFCPVRPECTDALAAFFAVLGDDSGTRHFHPHPFTRDEARRISDYTGLDLYYVAKLGSDIVAYGLLRGWDAGFTVPSLGIALHPHHRGTGLARAFMLFLHAAARLRGARRIRLKVYPDNVAAVRLYTSLGYIFVSEESGQQVGYAEL